MSSPHGLLSPAPFPQARLAAPGVLRPDPADILLVEDEVRVRRLLRDRLVAAGHRVREAGTVPDALRLVDAQAPALVITDLRLPGPSGAALIERLRERDAGIAVIAISGDPDSDVPISLREAVRHGAVRTLAKPFTTPQLLEAVEAALGPEGP